PARRGRGPEAPARGPLRPGRERHRGACAAASRRSTRDRERLPVPRIPRRRAGDHRRARRRGTGLGRLRPLPPRPQGGPALRRPPPAALRGALARGVPAGAPDIGGPGEPLRGGKPGLIVPPHRPDALAGALLALLDDPGRARAMGREGSADVAARFTPDRLAE